RGSPETARLLTDIPPECYTICIIPSHFPRNIVRFVFLCTVRRAAMLVSVLLFLVGLALLVKGGDWFVDAATALARRFRLPEILIGSTIVSIGTTLPEVMVSTTSALSGHGEMAYGNAIGS